MIAFWLLPWFVPASIVEMSDPSAREVSIQAMVKLPTLGAKDLAKLHIIVRAIPMQTEDYPRREMLTVTGGQSIRCILTPDVLRISEVVQPDNVRAGLSVMESLLRRATLTQENLDSAAAEATEPDYWSAALNPTVLPLVKVNQDEALGLYHRVIRPERLMLSVGGKLVPGEAQENWQKRMDAWNAVPEPKGYFDISTLSERDRNSSGVTTVDYMGEQIPAGDAAFSTDMLAMIALGSGKGASLFRIVREKHAWSYRQESVLYPTMTGWEPHLLFASLPSDEMVQRAETIKTEVLEEINGWSDEDLARALGMSNAVLSRNVDFNPLYVLGSGTLNGSLEDRTFMFGYWQLKTGKPWSPEGLLDSMRHVTLDDLKQRATAIVQSMKVRILAGG